MKPQNSWDRDTLILLLLGLCQAEEEENRAWGPSVAPFAHLKRRNNTKEPHLVISSIVMDCLALSNKYGTCGSPRSGSGHQPSATHRTLVLQNRKRTERTQGAGQGCAFQGNLSKEKDPWLAFTPEPVTPQSRFKKAT